MLVVLVTPSANRDCVAVLRHLVALRGVRIGLIGGMKVEHLPDDLRGALAGHYRVDNTGDAEQIALGVAAFTRQFGKVDRLIGYAEILQVQLAQVRERFGLPGIGVDVATAFRDKHRMKAILRQHGLPVAPQALVRSRADAVDFVAKVGLPVILKPTSGVGSQGTWRVGNAHELDRALQALQPSPTNAVQAEAFVTGDERTFESVLIDGEPVWCSQTLYLNRPLEILENPWMQWTVLFPREVLDDAGRAFLPAHVASLRALGLRTGMAHMEWFVREPGQHTISEVGARPPGASFMRMLGYTYDADLWQRWAELAVFDRWTPLPERRYAVGCAFFRAQGEGRRIVALDGLDAAQKAVGHLVIESNLPTIGHGARPTYEGDGFAVVRHEDTRVVFEALRTLIQTVRVRLG